MDSHGKTFPVCVPDLSDAGFYTSLLSQPTKLTDMKSAEANAMAANNMRRDSQPSKMLEINKSQSAHDVRLGGVSLRRVTPPKCTVSVKKNDTPMMNVVLRKVFVAF